MNKKKASSTLYFILFFIIFLAFCAFAVDGTIVFTNRAKLQSITETAALAAAEEFNSDTDDAISTTEKDNVKSVARRLFNTLKQGGLQTAEVGVNGVELNGQMVTLTTSMISQPFFLSFLGISGINLEARARARSETVPIYGGSAAGIRWATKRAVYQADVISNDSAVLKSLNTDASLSYSSDGNVNYGLISSGTNGVLSLGPGGFVTIKLPVPIIDKKGPDLYINEIGNREGYMVFAGLDNDPNNPYINHSDVGGGLSWVNISCTGTSKNITNPKYQVLTTLGNQTKFYGSGYFDIGSSCTGYIPVSMVKYIRIVDDNSESAFVSTNGTYYKSMMYGESSSSTPGADIESVQVLNYVHLTQ